MINLKINGEIMSLGEIDPETPLLWALRDTLGLVGTKYGCGVAQCGACTVLVDGSSTRSCLLTVGYLGESEITTIEGLAPSADTLHVLQQAWLDHDVAQCGYCQTGQLMSAAGLLARKADPSDEDIAQAMAGNLCRCGTYNRIASAIRSAAAQMATAVEAGTDRPQGARS